MASAADALDDEIADLRAQGKSDPPSTRRAGADRHLAAATLRKALEVQCSTLLSSGATAAAAAATPPKLAARSALQRAYAQQCGYRVCAPVTAFKVRDPDPCAVDGGHVLGLRFEFMSRGHFLQPYYLILNRPFAHAPRHLRVHRHTLPPAVPLAGLAARHLTAPARARAAEDQPRQDLDALVRALRREIARYHNRLGVSADLSRRLGLHEDRRRRASAAPIVDMGIADIEAKQIKLTWADDRTGRLVMDDDGNVLKLVVFGSQGRDWATAKDLFGKHDRMEDIARKLLQPGAGNFAGN